jgi:D-3-phosphoglycerate dehydrogenase
MGTDDEIERDILSRADADIVMSGREPDAIIEAGRDADALLINTGLVPEKVIESLEKCQVIVRTGIGVESIDIDAATGRGIMVCNVPDYCIDEVSDHAMGLLLSCARNIVAQDKLVRQGVWSAYATANPVHALRGAKLGLLGFGKIPRQMVPKAQAFGLDVSAFDPYVPAGQMEELGVRSRTWEELLRESDYLSAHVPLTPETQHMLDEAAFKAMKPSAHLINTARGGLVDTDALVRALKEGWIAGAGLDVLEMEHGTGGLSTDDPILALENVILTPHMGYYSEESLRGLRRMAVEEISRVLRGYWPKNLVNRAVRDRMKPNSYQEE